LNSILYWMRSPFPKEENPSISSASTN
jgi:hypothetical protein